MKMKMMPVMKMIELISFVVLFSFISAGLALINSRLLRYFFVNFVERVLIADRSVVPTGWKIIKSAPLDYPISFVIHLKQQNLERFNQLFHEISTPGTPQYRNFLTKQQIDDLLRPNPQIFEQFDAWLSSFSRF